MLMEKLKYVRNVLINHGQILLMANVFAIILVITNLIILVFVMIALLKVVLHVHIIKQNVIDVKLMKLIYKMENVFVVEMQL